MEENNNTYDQEAVLRSIFNYSNWKKILLILVTIIFCFVMGFDFAAAIKQFFGETSSSITKYRTITNYCNMTKK